MMGANIEDTSDITVMSVLMEGPAVSLKGSLIQPGRLDLVFALRLR